MMSRPLFDRSHHQKCSLIHLLKIYCPLLPPPCESHPPAFFSPSKVLYDLITESHDDHTSPPVSSHPVVSSTEVSPAPQEAVQELVEKLSAIAQQNGLVFDVPSLSQFVKNSAIRFQSSGSALD